MVKFLIWSWIFENRLWTIIFDLDMILFPLFYYIKLTIFQVYHFLFPVLQNINNKIKGAFKDWKSSPTTEKPFQTYRIKKLRHLSKYVNNILSLLSEIHVETDHSCEPCHKPWCGIWNIICNPIVFQSSVINNIHLIVGRINYWLCYIICGQTINLQHEHTFWNV